jgi:hypothetical protein
MDGIRQDLKFAARSLLKRPSFSVMVIVTLALGIGASTAIFSIVDAILLKPLPYAEPGRLVVFNERTPQGRRGLAWPNYVDFRDRARSLESTAAFRRTAFTVLDGGRARRANGRLVSARFFDALGVRPHLGRTFTEDDDRVGAAPVAIVGDRFWRQELGTDPGVVGRTLRTADNTFTIVGVLPSGFEFGSPDDIVAPIGPTIVPGSPFAARGNHGPLYAVARLRPGVGLDQARAELSCSCSGIASSSASNPRWRR